MSRKPVIVAGALVVAAAGAGIAVWRLAARDEGPAVREAWERSARAERPAGARIKSCEVEDKARLHLRATVDGRRAKGTAVLVRATGGTWRVEQELWRVVVEAHPQPPAEAVMPDEVAALVDRVASDDAMDACKAWIAIAARYRSSSAFLAEVKRALWDERPVHFEMVEDTFAGGRHSFRFFTVRTPGVKSAMIVPAATVGESLRYTLWQYEDVSNSGFKGDFEDWWDGWAPARGLPGGDP